MSVKRRTVWVTVAAVAAVVIVGAAVWLLWPGAETSTGAREPSRSEANEDVSGTDATALAQEQLDAHLAECTRPAAQPPPACGIRIPLAADFAAVDGIRYRIEQNPVVTLTPPTFRAEDGVLVATVTGTSLEGASQSITYRTENWMLRGDVSVTLTGVTLSPW